MIPTTGPIVTDDLSTVVDPVANDTWAFLTTDGELYKWSGSAWVPLTGAASGAPVDATYITQTPNATLTNEQALSALTAGLMKQSSGVVATAVAGVDYVTPGGTGGAVIVNAPLTGDGSSGSHLAIPPATSSVDGYLTSADWSTFNAKQAAGSYLTGVTADAPLSGSGTSGSHLVIANAAADGATKGAAAFNASDFDAASGVVSIDYTNGQKATAGQAGFLTAADWTTFNNKGSGSGSVTSVGLTMPTGFSVANSPVTTSGTLAVTTTLSGMVRGNGSALSAAEISGDGTTSGSNALTLATVNGNVGSFTNANITVNAKGLVTAAANGTGAGIIDAIEFVIDGGGSVITTGVKGDLEIPYGCTINRATLLADQSGSIVVDIWKDTYANFPPTVADSITASAKPTISSTTKSQDSTLTGWTTTITAGDTLRFNVDSITTCQRVTLSLKVTRT
jgi:hypothetical protein